ncbi:VIT family protein [Latilactobacillus sakei]|uniref:VIT1/CCC1 transporter family protein n=1 Tax=Latilactobacillus sakei TaxID=1599 RepID=UPI002092E859|nr:VIT family protein [Latilactobacillus sakei]USS38343.1 VIT family protein [Latilactobacillus sakei]
MKAITTTNAKPLEHHFHLSERLNIIRAGVLGANDGIISVAGIVVGVASAHQSQYTLFLADISGMLAGAFSMGGGEYVSVSTQRDTQKSMMRLQKEAIQNEYDAEVASLQRTYESKGLPTPLANQVATAFMQKDSLDITLREKYNIELHHYFNPWHAAFSSFFSFILGSLLPILTILAIPYPYKVSGTVASIVVALIITGYTSATLGHANRFKGILRNVLTGVLTMVVTYLIGGSIG